MKLSPSPESELPTESARYAARTTHCSITAIARIAVVAISVSMAATYVHATDPAPAVIETPLRGPWVPPQARVPSTAEPTRGAELHAQVEHKLEAAFEAADVDRTGALTRAQAKAAGLGFVVRHFDDIDVQRSGVVRFDDLKRYLDRRAAQSVSKK